MDLQLGFEDLPDPAPITFAVILIVTTILSSICTGDFI